MSARAGAPSGLVARGGGALALAGLTAALALYARQFTVSDWILTSCGALAIAFVATQALPIRGLRMRRTGVNAEAIILDLPIFAPLFAIGGAIGITASALALAAGYAAAAALRRAPAPTDLARHGAMRVLAVLAFLPFGERLSSLVVPAMATNAVFAAALTVAAVVFSLFVSAPLSSYTYHISIGHVWSRVLRDPRVWTIGVGAIAWATVARGPISQGNLSYAVILWLPVIVAAALLRAIEEQRAELHRLRLVRDAVQAMLGDRDPLPQINAMLATLRVPAFDETVTVLSATTARTEGWRAVTTLGPALTEAGDDLRRRILARLKFSGRKFTTLRDDYYVAYAFAARLADNELHGALIVHRRNDRPLSSEQTAQFTNAALELAPLLRDMRSITAAQNAATVDALTGLFNRATTMDRLQGMIEEFGLAGRGAALLLDIDHFKLINDKLGHAAGDDCLRRIGEIIRKTVRGGDIAGRIGGEEFLIVMPGASRDIALIIGERLRLAISLGGMLHATGEPVTTSIGVSAAAIDDTPEALLARADRALYEAKRQGRNRIVEERAESA